MLIRHDREKLIQAIKYFAERTKYCGKTKLFKLLYFLDFEHYRDAGRSVTGIDYFAWKMGPVPLGLYEEVDVPEPDLAAEVRFEAIPTKNGTMILAKALTPFDPKHFSKRELALLERLAQEYETAVAEDMIEETHLENRPWDRVYNREGKKQGRIPYEYAVNRQEEEIMKEIAKGRDEILKNFS